MSRTGEAAYGRMALFGMAVWRDERKASLVVVLSPIGRDRLMWRGRGDPRSLVRREWMLVPCSYDDGSLNESMSEDRSSYSAGLGYPVFIRRAL